MVEPTPMFGGRAGAQSTVEQPKGTLETVLESPETLVISALLESGEFNPAAYGLTEDMLASQHQAWAFCAEVQGATGAAPGIELFTRSFPDFELVSGVPIGWAADKLRVDYWSRSTRSKMREAIAEINNGNHDAANELLREAARPAQRARPKGMKARDPASVDEAGIKVAMPVPYATLQRETKGLGLGEFWVIGARLGQGKSMFLPRYTCCAAEYGFTAAVMTAEMPKRQWIARMHQQAAKDADHRKRLASEDKATRIVAVEELPDWLDNIEVLDPSDIEMGVRGIRLLAQEHQLVVMDHIGLFRDSHGKRSIEDWRVAASISNDCKEIALQSNVGLLAGSQINREGEGAQFKAPKISQLSQTDSLGQDIDVGITLRRMGRRAMLHDMGKNRNGEETRFYTKFDPKNGDFSEISKDEALSIQIADADTLGDL